MNESGKFEIYKKKLQGICDENDLVGRFIYDVYPIKMIVQPSTDLDSQISMLESAGDNGSGYISPDASIMFYFEDGELVERIKGTFDMSDSLKTKLKTLFKKMHYLYLQYFHRELVKYGLNYIPRISNGTEKPKEAEPIEEYEQGSFEDDDPAEGSESFTLLPADDADLKAAASIVRAKNYASTGMLRSEMGIGYSKAEQIMFSLEKYGVVGEYRDGGRREVLPWDEPEDE